MASDYLACLPGKVMILFVIPVTHGSALSEDYAITLGDDVETSGIPCAQDAYSGYLGRVRRSHLKLADLDVVLLKASDGIAPVCVLFACIRCAHD